MRVVLFVGPSVDERTLLDHAGPVRPELLPPVRRGDVDELFAQANPPDRVGIVDGEFLQGLSVSPKEILRAMDRHSAPTFYGSSSMGALRAAELADYGMVGVGRIFEGYRSGEIVADDEVAITFDPETREALCEPLANMRLAVRDALASGRLTQNTHDEFLAAATRLYFPDRVYRRVMTELADVLPDDQVRELSAYLEDKRPDAKRDDALALVELISTP